MPVPSGAISIIANGTKITSNSFNFVGKNGVTIDQSSDTITFSGPGSVNNVLVTASGGTTARTLSDHFSDIINLLDFGADPTGVSDSTSSIQNWINYCRTNNKLAYAPAGTYLHTSPINWGAWTGINVMGDGPGNESISGSIAQTKFIASFSSAQVAHDFSGSSYGKIANIAFDYDTGKTKPTVLILNARGSGGYASDVVWENCNWTAGSIAGALHHMAEVMTWSNCRGHSSLNAPALVITTNGGPGGWGVVSPFGYTFTNVVTLTVYRLFGGEFTGDNSSNVVFDHAGGLSNAVCIHGTYFAISGSNCAGVEFRGTWFAVFIDGIRVELDTASGSNNSYIYLNTATLQNSYLQMAGSSFGGSLIGIRSDGASNLVNTLTYLDADIIIAGWTEVTQLGYHAAFSNTTGSHNTAIGDSSLFANTDGSFNVAVGELALSTATSSVFNTAVGYQALVSSGSNPNNTALGALAGNNLDSGSNCTFLGYNTQAKNSNDTNEIVIGAGAIGKGSNTAFIAGTAFNGANTTTWATSSDYRLKQNINPILQGLKIIRSLRPVSFTYKLTGESSEGFIAQEYQKILPSQIFSYQPTDQEAALSNGENILGIQQNLVPYLVQAIQEMADQLETLSHQVKKLSAR